MQPGHFDAPGALSAFFSREARYETLARLEEWKCMGAPDFSDMSRKAVQKLLVRRDGANWEDFFINLTLADVAAPGDELGMPRKRWLITSIYKQGGA